MKNIILLIISVICLSCNKSDMDSFKEPIKKYFNPFDLMKLSLNNIDISSGFYMYQDIITMPDNALNEQIYQYWRIDNKTNKLVIIEESKKEISPSLGAYSDQIWYRNNSLGGKDIIEINKAICITEEELSKTINHYTKEAFAGIFVLTDIPFAGEKSWVPMETSPTDDYFTVMFCKHNVFIRLFVSIRGKEASESKQIVEKLAKQIVDNIDSFSVDKS